MKRLENKVAIITGAANGMGRAEAELFAAEGAKIVAVDLQEEELKNVEEAIRNAGGDVVTLVADVALEESWQEIVKIALNTYEKIDILINNAGIPSGGTNLEKFDKARWEKVLGIQLWGPVFGMRYVYPEMEKNGGGSIINVSSLSAFSAMGKASPYTAAKSAIWGLSRAAASDFAPYNIRVNVLVPGIVKTKLMGDIMDDENHPWMVQEGARIKMLNGTKPWYGDPMDAAYAALYYASDESRYITGTNLPIDGGYLTY